MYDLISIGDPTIDTFLSIHDAHVALDVDPDRAQLCIDYANKIPVDQFFRFPAGNSANNAVGSARLGLKTAIYGMIGRDSDGDWIINELKKEKVETKFMRRDLKLPTNSSSVLVFKKERTIFIWHQTRNYQTPVFPASKWVYFTSMGPLSPHLEGLHVVVSGYLKSHKAKLAFNPGTYQLMMGRQGLAGLLEQTEILFLNKEEARELTGTKSTDIKVLLRAMKDLGPTISVITDGPKGSYTYDGTTYWACGIWDTPVVERTGAGDSFGTGFTAARHYGLSIPDAMRWGTFNAAYVVGQFGGILGLVEKARMIKLSEENRELKVSEF